jgi:Na+/proline symporter
VLWEEADRLGMLSPLTILAVISAYFIVLYILASRVQGRGDNATFFTGNRASPWYLVAFGMIGASLSGVTFISIPGVVGAGGLNQAFSYMQMVMGYVLGYLVITTVLLPLYYKNNITSIYQILESRLGWGSYKSGAGFFILSRTIGAAFRLYLVAIVLDLFVFGPLGIPFWVTVGGTILLIWIYTFRGGIKTIVWTDTLQTTLMILAVLFTVAQLSFEISGDHFGLYSIVSQSDLSQWFYFEGGWADPNNFFKQFLAGALITIVMTGLDQDMMQKNLTCRNLKEAQTNMTVFSIVLFFVNILFLSLGVLLYVYAQNKGLDIPDRTDQLYPTIALNHLSPFISIAFILGLIAAAYSTADSALTSLTTSFCVDFLDMDVGASQEQSDAQKRRWVHVGFSVLLFVVIIIFNWLNNDAVINGLFKAAGYTYGPILGLFIYALLKEEHKGQDPGWAIIAVCIVAPLLTYILDSNDMFCGFKLGFLNLLLNGIISLLLISLVYWKYEKDH